MAPVLPQRSIFRGLALSSMAVALLSVLLLYGLTRYTITTATTAALSETVDTDLAGLADIYVSGGKSELIRRIADREQLIGQDNRRAHYLLADERGRAVAGSVQSWPRLSAQLSEDGYVVLDDKTPVYARATALAPDLKLLVAREYGADRALLRTIGWVFLGVGAAIVAAVTGLARSTAGRLGRRIRRINQSFRASAEGEIVLPSDDRQRPDEIGELSRHAAHTLTRLASLAQAQRHVSDHVAHEIRTPLMHLDQRLVGALKSSADPAAQAPLIKARDDIRGIVTMLDSLLDIAASEARRGDPRGMDDIDLSALITNLADLYADSFEESGHRLVTAIAPDIRLLGEPMQISRLVSNLLDNAIKYVPAGGTVTLTLAPGPEISVSDDGPGISDAARATIFDRFQRGASDHAAGGHGLGLALARAIAERHGLAISAEPTAKGAHFRIRREGVI